MKTQDPIDVVTKLYRLFGEGRLDETFELMHTDVVLREPGDPEVLPWAGTHEGHDGLRRFYGGLGEGLTEIAIDPESLQLCRAGDGGVLALGRERGVSSATGRAYETESAWLWTVRDGRISELRAFHDTAAMLQACSADPAASRR